jgi:hypothetical protein
MRKLKNGLPSRAKQGGLIKLKLGMGIHKQVIFEIIKRRCLRKSAKSSSFGPEVRSSISFFVPNPILNG